MRVPVALALFTLPLWACLSAPQPADPGARDASAQSDGSAGADADPNRIDASPVGGDLVCDGSSSSPFGRSYLIEAGSGNYAQIEDGTHENLDLAGSFTLEAWLNLSELPLDSQTFTILSKYDYGAVSLGYVWYVERNGSNIMVRCRVAQAEGERGSEIQWIWSAAEVDVWHHAAVIFDIEQVTVTGALRLLIDGVEIAGTQTYPDGDFDQTAVGDSAAPFTIGAWHHSGIKDSHFVGAIDDVRVWAHARTIAQVQDARFEPLVGTEAGLVGYWQFDGDLVDSSPSGNTLVGLSPEYCAGPSN